MSASGRALRGWIRTRTLLASVALGACACQSDPTVPAFTPPRSANPLVPSPNEPRREIHRKTFGGTEELFFVREVLVLPDGRRLRHGREIEWYRGGTVRHERFFERGEPAGLWRSWYPDGAPHSAVPCDPSLLRTATWWHANGRVSSEGPSVAGSKQGPWTHWHPNGAVAETGSYAGGLRQGEWMLWYEDGSVRARGSYRNDVRIGSWQWWTPEGVLVESSAPEPLPPSEDRRPDQ